ncbi:TVP38/TMEM64 family protein [Nitrospina sp. 32_T5]|uniref:TVP38/TMEM64 family protein n=1 Tax=unclassified Nitrospina TaxID=2638683 RepID=UPI003F98862A
MDLNYFFSQIDEYPLLGPIIFVLCYAILVTLLIPTLPVNLAAGVLWGGFFGGVLATFGSAIGAILAFLLARNSLGKPLTRKLNNHLFDWILRQMDESPWKVVAFVRLNPAFPSGPVNFIFGLTSINFKTYSYATLFFLFPPSLGVALIGAEAGKIILDQNSLNLLKVLSMILSGILILLIGYWAGKSLLKKKNT